MAKLSNVSEALGFSGLPISITFTQRIGANPDEVADRRLAYTCAEYALASIDVSSIDSVYWGRYTPTDYLSKASLFHPSMGAQGIRIESLVAEIEEFELTLLDRDYVVEELCTIKKMEPWYAACLRLNIVPIWSYWYPYPKPVLLLVPFEPLTALLENPEFVRALRELEQE